MEEQNQFELKFKVGDKVRRMPSIARTFGEEFAGGKVVEEIVKIERNEKMLRESKIWLSNGRYVTPTMLIIEKVEKEEIHSERKNSREAEPNNR